MNSINWYEIWCDEGLNPPYTLIVANYTDNSELISIIDPCENNKVIFSSSEYAEVKDFLLEDEYTMIKGRMSI